MKDATSDDHLFALREARGDEQAETLLVEPSPYTGGPWNPGHQHGGAVSALLASCVDRMPAPSPMRLARLSIDLFRGVPLTPLRCETKIVRGGRRIQSLDSTIFDGETPVARASALRIRTDPALAALDAPLAIDADAGAAPTEVPAFDLIKGIGEIPGFVRACDLVPGRVQQCGETATTWSRLRCRVFDEGESSATVRLAAVADFASGTGNAMDYTAFTSVNPDLSIHFLREPRTDWIAIRGVTARARDGIGQSAAALFDEEGLVARASATLLLDQR